jgi:hypothetical protein
MDFTDYPKSVTEQKADKLRKMDQNSWGVETPRDILIAVLRAIDNGDWDDVENVVIVCAHKSDKISGATSVSSAGPDFLTTLGMLARAIHLFNG